MSYRVYVKTKDLTREQWLRYRTEGIGGSDVSIIAGINPFKSVCELWRGKRGGSFRGNPTANTLTSERCWNQSSEGNLWKKPS